MSLLAEVVADALQEERQIDEGWLSVKEIAEKSAIRRTRYVNQTIRGVLNRLNQEGLAEWEKDNDGLQVWRSIIW